MIEHVEAVESAVPMLDAEADAPGREHLRRRRVLWRIVVEVEPAGHGHGSAGGADPVIRTAFRPVVPFPSARSRKPMGPITPIRRMLARCAGSVSTIQVTFGERANADHKTVTRDTYIDSLFPLVLHGTVDEALLDGNPASVMLLRFDLAALAPTVTVTTAALRIYTASIQNNPGFNVVETTGTWTNNEQWPGPTRDSTSLGGPASADQDMEYTVARRYFEFPQALSSICPGSAQRARPPLGI